MNSHRENNILGLIPARGGSRRVPRKNIKEFLGKPLLFWTIEAARESGVLKRLILNTDDPEIAQIGKDYGVKVPFMRPKELAQDDTPIFSVIKHTVEWLKDKEGFMPEWIILLEPSSPGHRPFHIREAIELIGKRDDIDSLVGISEIPSHYSPFKALKMNEKDMIFRYSDSEPIRNLIHRNQDLSKLYFINSALYAFKTENLFSARPSLWGDRALGYLMDSKYALDIDTLEDWIMAEVKMKRILEEEKSQTAQ